MNHVQRYLTPEDKVQANRAIWLSVLAASAGVVAVCFMLYTFVYMKTWTTRRDNLVCVPVDNDLAVPLVYRQSALHPLQSDAVIKNFVAQYVSLTKDEAIFKMRAVSDDSRFSEARISQNKWRAIHLSVGEEQAINKVAFQKSSELVNILKKGNLGWSFLIDDLIINTTPDSSYYVTVRGWYQVSYDARKSNLPPQFDGYREIQYFIILAPPKEDRDKNLINPYGLYVAKSFERVVPAAEVAMLQQRDSRYYLLNKED